MRYTPLVLLTLLLASIPEPASAQTARVLTDGATIWSRAGIPAIAVAVVKRGMELEVIARDEVWYEVVLPSDPSRTGFILAKQVELVSGEPPSRRIQPRQPVPGAGRPGAVRPASRTATPRGFVAIDGAYLLNVRKFQSTTTFTAFVEEGTRTVSYTGAKRPLFDASAGVGVGHGLFVGAAVSSVRGSSIAAVTAQVPHPFEFDRKRELTATVDSLTRNELAIHVQIAKSAPLGNRLQAVIAAGPSFFRLDQEFITDISYSEEYPYDTVTFTGASTDRTSKQAIGGHVQLDVIGYVSKNVGIDGMFRFSHAPVTIDLPDGSTLKAAAGGVQAGVGVRVGF